MNSPAPSRPSELVSAAQALDAQLARFEALAARLQQSALVSEQDLEHASTTLRDLADLDAQLREQVAQLVSAITRVRDRQQHQAEAVNTRARELQARTEVFKALLTRYGALGQSAAELNARMQRFSALSQQPSRTSEQDVELAEQFQSLQERMTQVAQESRALAETAEASQFSDIARQAGGLGQQLQSALHALGVLRAHLLASG
ncbi:hypothetical protein DRW03_15880 [Corallococcus sp. H22C18031201]|nr:hypothetical protein DRW03_15880 [Corallococcus sp. H22C18031201]